jgi:hypothetical protein
MVLTREQNRRRLDKLIRRAIREGMDPGDQASIERAFDRLRLGMDDELLDYCFAVGTLTRAGSTEETR